MSSAVHPKAVFREDLDGKANKNESFSATGTSYHLRSSMTTIDLTPPSNSNSIRELETESETDLLNMDGDLEFPEGGLKANLVLLGSFLGLLPAFGLTNAVGPIQAYVSTHQLATVSASTVSWIFSIYLFFAFGSSVFSGALFDRVGARLPMVLGTLLYAGGMFATANCHDVYQFILSFGVLIGFGTGMVMSPLVGVISHYFKKNRATACSIATTGGSVGGVIFPVMLRKLYAEVGFQWAMRIFGFLSAFCLISATLLIKERVVNKDDAASGETNLVKIYFKNMFDFRALKDPKFIFCSIGVALSESSLVISSVYFTSYAIRNGIPENTAYLLVTVLNATGILGRYIPGLISDKLLGCFNVVVISITLSVVFNFTLWLPFGYSLKVLYVYSALYGFCSGSILSLSPACCGQVSRTDEFGKRYSTCYLIVSSSMLALTPIGGAILGGESLREYNNLIIYSSCLGLAGAISYFLGRVYCVGWGFKKF